MCWTPYNNSPTPITRSVEWLVGASSTNVRSAMGWIQSRLPAVRGVLENVPHPYAQTGANVMKALGYGKGQRPIDNRLA
jgi:hypothetical protein